MNENPASNFNQSYFYSSFLFFVPHSLEYKWNITIYLSIKTTTKLSQFDFYKQHAQFFSKFSSLLATFDRAFDAHFI